MLIFLTRRRTAAEHVLDNSGLGDRIAMATPPDAKDPLQLDEHTLRQAAATDSESSLVAFLEFLAKRRDLSMSAVEAMTPEHAQLAAIAFGIANGTFVTTTAAVGS